MTPVSSNDAYSPDTELISRPCPRGGQRARSLAPELLLFCSAARRRSRGSTLSARSLVRLRGWGWGGRRGEEREKERTEPLCFLRLESFASLSSSVGSLATPSPPLPLPLPRPPTLCCAARQGGSCSSTRALLAAASTAAPGVHGWK